MNAPEKAEWHSDAAASDKPAQAFDDRRVDKAKMPTRDKHLPASTLNRPAPPGEYRQRHRTALGFIAVTPAFMMSFEHARQRRR